MTTTHVRVAVIGGGVVGASVLYHLARAGWKDLLLIERDELTSGSTWHAAGGFHPLNGDPNVAKLQKYTIELYKEIEAASGQSIGMHLTGGFDLACTPARIEFLKIACARGRYLGLDLEMVTLDDVAKRLPIIDTRPFMGALWSPYEGHVDPYGVTHAYAGAARKLGAKVQLHTRVEAISRAPDGAWDLATPSGTIRAEHVVNAGGLWAREVGRMVGIELPVLAMEHHYLITEDIPVVRDAGYEMPHVVDFDGEIYMRQEGMGMLIGTYEKQGVPWSPRTTPWDFTYALLNPDLDRIAENLAVGFTHYPALGEAGIKKTVNGPFTFAPDGNPLVGPVRALPNFWVACGVMAGLSQGGGVGLALANWMTEGDPGFDIWGMDVSRFGDWTTPAYTNAKVRENYGRRFRVRFPNEELPAGRPLRTSPVYDRMKSAGAVYGVSYGLEVPLWFAADGQKAEEEVTYRRSNAHEPVGQEVRAVRQGVGLMDTTSYSRFEVSGPGARAWLSRIFAGRIPATGRIALNPMLNTRGRVIGDFTIACAGAEHFVLFGSGAAEEYHLRWWAQHPPPPEVTLKSLRRDWAGLAVAGPRSRDLLSLLAGDAIGADRLPFMGFARINIERFPVHVGRLSFTGELGYELWVPAEYQLGLYDVLTQAGRAFDLRLFGSRALHSMRLEKAWGTWARDYRPIYSASETGMTRFIDRVRTDYIGHEALKAATGHRPSRRLVALSVDDAGVDASGDEPIWHDGAVVGWVTSGGWGHAVGQSLALGYVPGTLADTACGLEVEVLGERRPARILPEAPYDPAGERMRV
ncbi:MAG: hypothetical protein RL322_545 [Pseudomonadota bacterium]|jgi:dimethylglycine dehydrogenase